MVNLAILWVTFSIVVGIVLALLYGWKRRNATGAFLLFFLPLLLFFLWHFSVEAYNWGQVWNEAQIKSNSQEVTLEIAIAIALIDLKVLFTIFLIIVWIYVWKSVNQNKKSKWKFIQTR